MTETQRLLPCNFHLYLYNIVFVSTCVLLLEIVLFRILYVTNIVLWIQDFNKLTYLLTYYQRR